MRNRKLFENSYFNKSRKDPRGGDLINIIANLILIFNIREVIDQLSIESIRHYVNAFTACPMRKLTIT